MREVQGDVWAASDAVVLVPTNGVINSRGHLVMGAGVAQQARNKYKHLNIMLGSHVRLSGNIPCYIAACKVISFPTKHHWSDKFSDINLIQASAAAALKLVNDNDILSVSGVRVGCGLGGLKWDDVRAVLRDIFDERFTIYS